MSLRLIRLPEVMNKTGLSRASLYRAVQFGEFPKPVAIGLRAVAWSEEVVDKWIKAKIAAANQTPPAKRR